MCARKRERERKRERKRERRSYFIIMLHELFNKFNGLIVREDLYFLYKHNISRIALGKLSEQKKTRGRKLVESSNSAAVYSFEMHIFALCCGQQMEGEI